MSIIEQVPKKHFLVIPYEGLGCLIGAALPEDIALAESYLKK